MATLTSLPKQTIPDAEKSNKFYEESIRYFVENSGAIMDSEIKAKMEDVLLAFEGELSDETYAYVLNPYNSKDAQDKKRPARLRNYDILSPVVSAFLGEFDLYAPDPVVTTSSTSIDSEYQKFLNSKVDKILTEKAVSYLKQSELFQGESQKQPPVKESVEGISLSFTDKRLKLGQEILDYIFFEQEIRDKRQTLLEEYIKLGTTLSYKEVYNDDVYFHALSALDVFDFGNKDKRLREDCDAIVVRRRGTMQEIIDRFHNVLKQDQLDELENGLIGNRNTNGGGNNFFYNIDLGRKRLSKESVPNSDNEFYYYHVTWKGKTRVGELKFINELGEEDLMEVPDGYKLSKETGDISIKWHYINTLLHGFNSGDLYWCYTPNKSGEPYPIQRQRINNRSACKHPYNGIRLQTLSGNLNSIGYRGLQYQVMYNVLRYRTEATIAAHKGDLMILPKGLIPKGWSEEKWLYFVEVFRTGFVDESAPKFATAIQALKAVSLNLYNYITQMIELCNDIKQEWWDYVGMNRQRLGDIHASDGKSNTNKAIQQSATITQEFFRKFEHYMDREYQGILDISKVAYVNGKNAKYIRSDESLAVLEVLPEDLVESDFNTFVRSTKKEAGNLETMRDLTQAMAQNGGVEMIEALPDIIRSNNMTQLSTYLKRAVQVQRNVQQQKDQADRDSNEKIAQMNNDTQKMKNDIEIYKADKDYDKAIDVKAMELQGMVNQLFGEDSSESDSFKEFIQLKQLENKEKETETKDRQHQEKIQLGKEQIQSQEKVAKMNKN